MIEFALSTIFLSILINSFFIKILLILILWKVNPLNKDINTANEKYKITKVIAAIEIFLLSIIFILFYLTREVETYRVIYVPKGSTNYTIKALQNRGIDINLFDKIFIRMFGYPQAGWIDLKSTKMSKLDLLYRLTTSKAALAKIVIIPGESNYFIYKQIEKQLN